MPSPSPSDSAENKRPVLRILIADDHLIVREGLRGILNGPPDMHVIAEASNGIDAIRLCKQHVPEIVLVDLEMPQLNGVETIRQLAALGLPCRPIVLTTYDSDHDIAQAVAAGAYGYLLKDIPRFELFEAIRAVAAGNKIVPSRQTERPTADTLSRREIDVLTLLAEGASNDAIGQALHISIATVKTHLARIYRKLDVDDRTSAVTVAVRRKIIRIAGD